MTTTEALNVAFEKDPNAVHALLVNRVPCNQALADDEFMKVDTSPVLSNGNFQIGALGLLNGVLAANGLTLVSAKWSDEQDSQGRWKLMGFYEYQP